MSEKISKNQPNQSIASQQQSDEIDLRHLIAMFLDGRYIITGVIAIAFSLALLYVLYSDPYFQG